MNELSKARIKPLIAMIALIGLAACESSFTSPQVTGKRAQRDTTVAMGDTINCRSGWQITGGRVVCNPNQ